MEDDRFERNAECRLSSLASIFDLNIGRISVVSIVRN